MAVLGLVGFSTAAGFRSSSFCVLFSWSEERTLNWFNFTSLSAASVPLARKMEGSVDSGENGNCELLA